MDPPGLSAPVTPKGTVTPEGTMTPKTPVGPKGTVMRAPQYHAAMTL